MGGSLSPLKTASLANQTLALGESAASLDHLDDIRTHQLVNLLDVLEVEEREVAPVD